jgi:hypothetical protein
MLYQRKTLPDTLMGDPAPLPAELVGLSDACLADLSAAIPEAAAELGYAGQGFFPFVPDPPLAERLIEEPFLLHQLLDELFGSMPEFKEGVPVGEADHLWLGHATALIDLQADIQDKDEFRKAARSLSGLEHDRHVQTIRNIVSIALKKSELALPIRSEVNFIPKGGVFQAFSRFNQVIRNAKKDVMIVDPYANHVILTDFASQIANNITIRILTKSSKNKYLLIKALSRWIIEHGNTKPIQIKIAKREYLHDRFLVVDRINAWQLGQSFANIAQKTHTNFARIDHDAAAKNISELESLWDEASDMEPE